MTINENRMMFLDLPCSHEALIVDSHLVYSDGMGSYVLAAASSHGPQWTVSSVLAGCEALHCLVVRGRALGRETPYLEGQLFPGLGCC